MLLRSSKLVLLSPVVIRLMFFTKIEGAIGFQGYCRGGMREWKYNVLTKTQQFFLNKYVSDCYKIWLFPEFLKSWFRPPSPHLRSILIVFLQQQHFGSSSSTIPADVPHIASSFKSLKNAFVFKVFLILLNTKSVSDPVSKMTSLNLNIKLYDTCNKWIFTMKNPICLTRSLWRSSDPSHGVSCYF